MDNIGPVQSLYRPVCGLSGSLLSVNIWITKGLISHCIGQCVAAQDLWCLLIYGQLRARSVTV